MDVFISYSRKDYIDRNQNPIKGNVISVLEELFKSNGITYWIDRDGIYSGSEFAQVIARNIKKCDILLFVSSENSNNSKWTSNELATAIEYNKLIIPFRVDESSYHEDIVLYLAKLDYISYFANKEKALKRLLVAISDYKGKLERERLEALQKEKEEEERLRQEEEKKRELFLKEQELKEKERLAAIALEKQRQIEKLNYVHDQIYELEQSVSLLQNKKDELVKENNNVIREINILTKRLEHLNTQRIIIETQLTGKNNNTHQLPKQQLPKQQQQKSTSNTFLKSVQDWHHKKLYLISSIIAVVSVPFSIFILFILGSNTTLKSIKDWLNGKMFYLICAIMVVVAVSISIFWLCSNPHIEPPEPIDFNDSTITVNIDSLWEESKPEILIEEIEEFKDTTYVVNGVSFKMIAVKGGKFLMGSNDGEDNEKPVHQVTLSDYYIGETEVTQELWVALMGSNPSYNNDDDQCPVDDVSWFDCQKFIYHLNELTGERFSLPSEAQWEYAARGGNKSHGYIYSGSNIIDEVAWYKKDMHTAHCVKTKAPNELGIYDMSGNVWEWCYDRYDNYSSVNQTAPSDQEKEFHKVNRGGCLLSVAPDCSVTNRNYSEPTWSCRGLGLRLAISLTSTEKE